MQTFNNTVRKKFEFANAGKDPGGGAPGARPRPLKKDMRDWIDNRLMLNT